MPTVLRIGPYRLYFYRHEGSEPPHIHVDRDAQTAKFWLDPVALVRNLGYNPKEFGHVERIVRKHRVELLEAWDEHFGH